MAAETKVRTGGEPKVNLSAKIVAGVKVRREDKIHSGGEAKVGN